MRLSRGHLWFVAVTGLTVAVALAKVPIRKPHVFEAVSHAKNSLRGTQAFNVPQISPANRFLTDFSFSFENGDHRLRSVGVWPVGEKVHSSFADANGDDPYQVVARWSSMPSYWLDTSEKKVAKHTSCKGACSFPLDPGPWEHAKVLLQGFHFTRPTGDLKVHKLSLFASDARAGRGKEFHTAFMAEMESYDERNSVERARLKESPYSVEVTYVTVDPRRCKGGTVKGTKAKGQSTLKLETEPGRKAIMAFSFEFLDGGHHLKSWGVQTLDRHIVVTMNDNNLDDEVEAHVNYCVIDEAAAKKGGPDPIGSDGR